VQIMSSVQLQNSESYTTVIRIHPLLFEFLSLAAAFEVEENQQHESSPAFDVGSETNSFPVSIAPLPLGCFDVSVENNSSACCSWFAQPSKGIQDLPLDCSVTLQILYKYDDRGVSTDHENQNDNSRWLSLALQGRLILKGTTILLTAISTSGSVGYVVAVIKDIAATCTTQARVYRVGDPDTYSLKILPSQQAVNNTCDSIEEIMYESSPPSWHDAKDCPGYESLLEDLVRLLVLTQNDNTAAAAPTGILLSGCAGVGKTRLAVASASRLQRVHWISVHDLVLQAAWATEEVLMDCMLKPPSGNHHVVLVLDDLDALGNNDESSCANDYERRLVRNSIVQVIDQLVLQRRRVAVLGIGRDSAQLPTELVKVGRLEKEVTMVPPSQRQREQILYSMLIELLKGSIETTEDTEDVRGVCTKWAELLATMTAGCVAADIRRLCADAWNRSLARNAAADDIESLDLGTLLGALPHHSPVTWEDLTEAAQNCVPSQLAALDVTKPTNFVESCSTEDWPRIHELSWKGFAGYESTKRHVYRTAVVPWRRILSRDSLVLSPGSITPPSGILFHGPSGCGKTFAASCLGSSLGLPMIKVRAADVLDKWLGGSEAAIRSLFTRARAAAPSILFFDEIDAVACNRANSEDGATADVMSRLLSTLLNEMDGVSSGQQTRVLVVACTNRLETLDAALLRPGRLEEHILLSKPLIEDAKEILKHCFALAPLCDRVDLDGVAQNLVHKSASGADIEGTCREAVVRALRRCPRDPADLSITLDDINGAMDAMKLIS
jgi:SpoVK/Ycf46/Vps4 family AAA+-type ATPase